MKNLTWLLANRPFSRRQKFETFSRSLRPPRTPGSMMRRRHRGVATPRIGGIPTSLIRGCGGAWKVENCASKKSFNFWRGWTEINWKVSKCFEKSLRSGDWKNRKCFNVQNSAKSHECEIIVKIYLGIPFVDSHVFTKRAPCTLFMGTGQRIKVHA